MIEKQRFYTPSELADCLKISKSTFFRDMKKIREKLLSLSTGEAKRIKVYNPRQVLEIVRYYEDNYSSE